MAGHSLTMTSSLQCPHSGRVVIISANTRVRAASIPMALATDVFMIVGCLSSSPCVTVQWLVTDMRVRVNGIPTLSRSSVGLCLNGLQIPQGPVIVVNTQVRVQSQ
jgi:hypothetical protein